MIGQSSDASSNIRYCGVTASELFRVELGEEAHLPVLINFRWPMMGTDLVLMKTTGVEIGRCSGTKFEANNMNNGSGLYNTSCHVLQNDKFRMVIDGHCVGFCYLHVFFNFNEEEDAGLYYIELDQASCRYITANITVQEIKPMCSVYMNMVEKSLDFFCKWKPGNSEDRVRLTSKNRTLYTATTLAKTDSNLNDSHVISAMVSLEDILSDHKVPDMCIVFQFGREKTCRYSLFMEPRTYNLNDSKSSAAYISCCIVRDRTTNVWLYSENGLALLQTNSTTNFTTFMGTDNESNHIMVLCGEEISHRFILYGIGRVVVNPKTCLQISTSNINSNGSRETAHHCALKYTINVSIFSQHIPRTTDSTPESVTFGRSTFVKNLTFNDKISFMSSVSRNGEDFYFHDDHQAALWISILMISTLALIFSVAICLKSLFRRFTTPWVPGAQKRNRRQ